MTDQSQTVGINGGEASHFLPQSPQTASLESGGQTAPPGCDVTCAAKDAASNENTEDDGVPYDHGWAWMIVVGAFINVTILSGYIKATGIFFVELLSQFGAPASQTSLIFSIRYAVFSISGLFIMNAVVGRLGARRTVLIGSFCVSMSAILASLATDLIAIICVQSILLGVGMATLVSPGDVLVGAYFKRRRSFALALARCGGSVGSFAVPPLVVYLLQEYGLKGALLVCGAFCLHSVPAALLFRPTSFYKKIKQRRATDDLAAEEAKIDANDDLQGSNKTITSPDSQITNGLPTRVEVKRDRRENFAGNTFSSAMINSEKHETVKNNGDKNRGEIAGLAKSLPEILVLRREEERFFKSRKRTFSEPVQVDMTAPKRGTESDKRGILEKANESLIAKYISMASLEPGSMPFVDVSSFAGKHSVNEGAGRGAEEESLVVSGSTDRTPGRRRETAQGNAFIRCCTFATSVLDFTLLRRPTFRMLLVYFAFSTVVNITTNLLPAAATQKGVSKAEAALLLSVTGGLDLACRLGTGFIADSKKLQTSTMVVIAFVTLSIATQFVRFMTSFVHFLLFAVVYGLLGGVGNVLGPILVIEYSGLENMSKGLGFAQFVSGASMCIMYPVLGYIRDATGSYAATYHVIGCGILLAAGILLLVRLVHRWETHRQRKGQDI